MITAGYYWDYKEHELLNVSCFDNNRSAFPYTTVYSKQAPGFTSGFRPGSVRQQCLVRVDNCTSLTDVQLRYPELFI